MWRSGRRLYSTAGVLMILTAMAHTAGNLAPNPDVALAQVLALMKDSHIAMGLGMRPSVFDIYRCLVWTMSITFLALGVLTLAVTGSSESTAGLLRRVSWINAVWVGGFLAITVVYQIPPPLISAVLIEVVLIASLVSAERGGGATA